MKISELVCGWLVLHAMSSSGLAATFDLNNVKGLWEFNGNLNPHWVSCQQPLTTPGLVIGGSPGPRYTSAGRSTWLDLRSDSSPYAGLKPDEILRIANPAGPNGPAGASFTNSWTLVMDVRIPASTGTIALVQDSTSTTETEIFLNSSRQLVFGYATGPGGANPVASGPIATGTWVRLGFTSFYNSVLHRNILKAYVNGTVTSQSSGGALLGTADGHYGLASAFALFSGPAGSTAPIEIDGLGFWGRALSANDLTAIGDIDAIGDSGIDWPDMTPPTGWPPLPLLTGKLMFKQFETLVTPDMAALAASASAPASPGTIAEVEVNSGSCVIPGMPNHTFSTPVSAYVLADGTLVSRDLVRVYFIPPGEVDTDIAEVGGVTFIRPARRVVLDPAAGALAEILDVCLPAGFGVAMNASDGLLLATPRLTNVALDSRLRPYAPVQLRRQHFDGGSGSIRPVLDRVPVRFSTAEVLWSPIDGTFLFNQNADPVTYHRKPQLTVVAAQQAAGLPGAAIVPPSNDGYFLAAKLANGPVEIKARPNGAALVNQLNLNLDGTALGGTGTFTGYSPHYPLMSVAWDGTDSRIRFSNDAIIPADSWLSGARISSTSYQRAPTETNAACPNPSVTPAEAFYFRPLGSVWRFTPDGGLRAAVAVGPTPTFPFSGTFTPEWCGFQDDQVQKFAHAITNTGGFTQARVITGGTAVRADVLPANLPEHQRVAALLLSGFSSPDDEELIERPQTTGFELGLADYPGVNLRGNDGATAHAATSIIAGVAINPPSYELAKEAKYCIRPGGVNGVHLAASGSGNITFSGFGADFELSRLILSYRDGRNVASGVGGSLYMGKPAEFSLVFGSLKLGEQGQLESAEINPDMGTVTMGPKAWNLEFKPLSLDFPQPVTCPEATPDKAFVRIGASAQLTGLGDATFVGNLSFLNGNIVTEAMPEALGAGPVSRFHPGSLLRLKGTAQTGGKPWNINPVTDIYVNQWDGGPGTLTVGGLMDVPFFVDVPVVLSTGSSNKDSVPPEVFVRAAWEKLDVAVYDPDHRGFPGPAANVAEYRERADYDPVATRDWQDLIAFSLPIRMESDRVLRSRSAVANQDLMLFTLTESVRSMTPDNAELTLDGRSTTQMTELSKQVNVATLLGDSSGMGAQQAAIDGGLACVRQLDALLADHTHALLDPGLETLAGQNLTPAFFSELSQASAKSAKLDTLVGDDSGGLTYEILQMFVGSASAAHWRTAISARVEAARDGLTEAGALVQNQATVKALAGALATRMGLGNPPGDPDDARRQAVLARMEQTITRLDNMANAIGPSGKLTISLHLALGNATAVAAIVQQAVNDVKQRWAPADPAKGEALYNSPGAREALAADLTAALADRFAGSAFAAGCGQLLRQSAGDPQTLARQALDDTLRMACQLVADTNAAKATIRANGGIGDYVSVDNLTGYGRITGDSLHELRLDGKVALEVHDWLPKMDFDGWFMVRDIDSSTPASSGMDDSVVKAEISAGATTTMDWGTQPTEIVLGGKVGIGSEGQPVCYMGDIAMAGELDFSAVTLDDLKLGFGMGADNAYFYGRASGDIKAMSVAAGVFFGKTTDQEVLKNADKDIGSVIEATTQNPVTGAIVYAEGSMSLMPLIGIPPSCLLDLRLGGGNGYFMFVHGDTLQGGFKIVMSASGELLCLVDVSGGFGAVLYGSAKIGGSSPIELKDISGKAWATLEGEIGYDPFSYSFDKRVGISLKIGGDGSINWNVDY